MTTPNYDINIYWAQLEQRFNEALAQHKAEIARLQTQIDAIKARRDREAFERSRGIRR